MSAVVARGVERKGSPAAPDLEQAVPRLDAELASNDVQLLNLGEFERIILMTEIRAGVHELRIEEKTVKIVAKVVVSTNVATRTAERI